MFTELNTNIRGNEMYSKNRKMKKVEVDDLVVVNDLPDTTVYMVCSVENGQAELEYESGYKKINAGKMPVELLLKPTKEQLKNSGLN